MGDFAWHPAHGVSPGGLRLSVLLWIAAVAAALLLAASPGDLYAQAAGEAVAVSGSVSANGPPGDRRLVVGGAVYRGDTIDTGLAGEAQIVFTDETRLAVGPGSRMVIDDYVLQTPTTTSRFAIGAARGAFRFISGGSRSNAYEVSTPTATIGIRGTAFDFSERTGQRTNTLLYDGRITTCNLAGRCTNLDRACAVSVVFADPDAPVLQSDTGDLVPGAIRFQFPYLVDEARLLPAFRVQAGRCLGNGGRTEPAYEGGGIDQSGRDRPAAEPAADPGDNDGDTGGETDGETGNGETGNGETGNGETGNGETGNGDTGGETGGDFGGDVSGDLF